MPRIDLPEAYADPHVEPIFKEIEGAFGKVPNLFRTYAQFPPLLEANWNKVKAVMMGGSLSRQLKEAIAVLVSRDNGCDYCVAAHKRRCGRSASRRKKSGRSRRTWKRAPSPPKNRP